MQEIGLKPNHFSIKNIGINTNKAYWNQSPKELTKTLLDSGEATQTSTGALAIDTGEFTGRSPKDRFIVKDDLTKNTVWWSRFNIPFDPDRFENLYKKMKTHLNDREVYVRDVYAGADPRYQINIRAVTESAWSNLFIYNMFLLPNRDQLESFNAEWTLLCAPSFKANPETDKTRQHNFSIIDFTRKILLIGGSGYTGEIKKGIFSILNFILPLQKNVLSMHCSANIGKNGDNALFFGLSGTGKTTLSADPERALIGDDEHGWAEDGTIFNFEGGCYAKTLHLNKEKEPAIFEAIKEGSLLENTVYKKNSCEIDYTNGSKTENTRVSYPIEYIKNSVIPSIGKEPKNIFFLTCDAFGTLPPISKLTPEQAAFHFISGYTAKVAGTEIGITQPKTTFSACFGAPFMPLHPTKYANMLTQKMKKTNTNVWLVNTGWLGGTYKTSKRIPLQYTRSLIKAALKGDLDQVPYEKNTAFDLSIPTSCPAVPDKILNPRNTWENKEAYDQTAEDLVLAFRNNFKQFTEQNKNNIPPS